MTDEKFMPMTAAAVETANKLVPTSEFGNNLVQIAAEDRRRKLSASMVLFVQRIMESKDAAQQIVEANQQYIAKAEKQLEAINSGQFSINGSFQIVFNDPTLKD